MNIVVVSYSKIFSDTRVIKYIKLYLEKSFSVYTLGIDKNDNNFLSENKKFYYYELNYLPQKICNYMYWLFYMIPITIVTFIILLLELNFNHSNLLYLKFFFIFIFFFFVIFLRNALIRITEVINKYRSYSKKMKDILDLKKIDIIHAHDLWTVFSAFKLKRRCPKSKLIIDLHELYSELPKQSYFKKKIAQFFLNYLKINKKKVFKFITINDHLKNYYEKNYRFKPMFVVNNSCEDNQKRISDIPNNLKQIKNDNKKILLYHGGLAEYRGIIEICNFFVNHNTDNWIFYMIGNGNLEGKIDQIIKKNPKKNIFHQNTVPLNELEAYTSQADLGVINYENNCLNHNYCNPNKLWEYSRCSLPMLLSNCNSFIDLNKKYNFAKIIDNNNLNEIFAKLNQQELRRMGKKSRLFFESECWEKQKKIFIQNILNVK
jgi:glycosyltransferase involved in cell wall biosynthesis